MLSNFSHVRLFATPWTAACQAPLSMGFSRQEYWSGLPCPPPRYLLEAGIKHLSLISLALTAEFIITSTIWEAHMMVLGIPLKERHNFHPYRAYSYWRHIQQRENGKCYKHALHGDTGARRGEAGDEVLTSNTVSCHFSLLNISQVSPLLDSSPNVTLV